MPSTTRHGFPSPLASAAPNVPIDIKALADSVDLQTPWVSTTTPTHGNGLVWFNPTTGLTYISDGAAWQPITSGLWQTYNPTWTIQALGASTTTGSEYQQIGKTVDVCGVLTAGAGASLGTGPISMSLPVQAANPGTGALFQGHATIRTQVGGTIYRLHTVLVPSGSSVALYATDAAAGTAAQAAAFVNPGAASLPFTVSPASVLNVQLRYKSI